jgi:hypothetical protein
MLMSKRDPNGLQFSTLEINKLFYISLKFAGFIAALFLNPAKI